MTTFAGFMVGESTFIIKSFRKIELLRAACLTLEKKFWPVGAARLDNVAAISTKIDAKQLDWGSD